MKELQARIGRRDFLTLSAATAAGALLAACQPAATPAPATQPPAEAEEPTAAPVEEPEPTAAPAQSEPVQLDLLLVSWNDDYRTLMEGELLPAFQEANPGVTVVPDYTTWGDLDPKVMTAFASGLAPDLFQADTIEFGVKYYDKDILMEFDPYVEAAGGDAALADFYQKGLTEGATVDGKLIGIPYECDNRSEFYRTDFFEEVGLDPENPPEDWVDFREAAIALTVRDGDTITRAGYHWWARAWAIQEFFPFMWQNGGSMLNETMDRAAFDSDEAIEALEFITNLLRVDMVGPLEEMPAVGDLGPLLAGTRAMSPGGYGTIFSCQQYAPDLFPKLRLFIPKNKVAGHLWYVNTFHMTKGDQMDLSWKLIEHLVLDDDNFLKHHEAMGSAPPRQSITERAKHVNPLLRQLIDGVFAAAGSHTTDPVPFAGEIFPRVDEAIAKSLYGEASPRDALTLAAEEANQIIDRYLSEA